MARSGTGTELGLFLAKFVKFGFFENHLAGRKMAIKPNCFWPILKFVVITVLYAKTLLKITYFDRNLLQVVLSLRCDDNHYLYI